MNTTTEILNNSNNSNNNYISTIASIDMSGSKSEETFQTSIIRNSSSGGDFDEPIPIAENYDTRKPNIISTDDLIEKQQQLTSNSPIDITPTITTTNNNNNNPTTNSAKALLESPTSSSSGSSIASSIYQPIIREINQNINPPTLNISTDQIFKPDALSSLNENNNNSDFSSKVVEEEETTDDEINKIVNSTDKSLIITATSTTTTTTTTTESNLNESSSSQLSEIDLSQSIIINNNLNRTLSPLYSSTGPEVRDSVNGFPLKINHLKIKEFQWLKQIKNYTQDNTITLEIIKLVRLGIPRRIRGYVWRFFSGATELERKNIGVYQHFLSKSSEEYEYKISKDISRTFPNNPDFNTVEGQNSLFRILKAYSIMDPEIGYTQGMSFIVATLLSEMDEVESFWAFTSIMKNYKLSTLYCNDLSLLRQYLYVIDRLIETTNPKLFSHLKEIGVTPVLFASEWISTLYTYNFDFKISKRLLDVFFIEGRFYLHKMAIAILKIYEKQLLGFAFEEAVEFLKKLGNQIEPDVLFKISDTLPITEKMIMDFEEEFVHPNAPSDYF